MKKLEKLDLILRKPLEKDMLKNHLNLTEQGYLVLQKEIDLANQHIKTLINHLDTNEQIELVNKMSGILRQMKVLRICLEGLLSVYLRRKRI